VESIQELIDKLPEEERAEWLQLLRSQWYQGLNPRIREVVLQAPPIYLYRLSGIELVEIKSYEENKLDHEEPIWLCVKVKPEWNASYAIEREVWGVPPRELKREALLTVARRQRRVSVGKGLGWMKRLQNTRNRDDVLRGNAQ
jgi:hypothetical protein